jgi:Concanavalin A-like lectin/glucanases superfamily
MVYAWVMHRCALVVALAGCGFHGAEVTDARTIDMAIDVEPDMSVSTFCDPIDGLIACYEFDNSTLDATANHLDATPVNVMYGMGQVNSALQIAANSSATVAASNKFDVTEVTIEAWVKPTSLPAGGKFAVVLDVDNQYALWINDNGTLSCDLHGATRVTSTTAVATMMWNHVACTYDRSIARIYLNGGLAGSRNGSGDLTRSAPAMAIGGNSPSGSPMIGLIDELRLLSVARSGPLLCSDAGQTNCP